VFEVPVFWSRPRSSAWRSATRCRTR